MPEGHVYILGSTTGTLYTDVTCKFDQRLFEHRNGIKSGCPQNTDATASSCTSASSTSVPPSPAKR
jgi:predicted GIY-YIG superfamily endonuclease